MNGHRFILQPYKGVGSRHICPACGKRNCFSRYIDVENRLVFPDNVGRCNHEQSCGYHFTPKEYFERNPQLRPFDFTAPSTRQAGLTEPEKSTSCIAAETVSQTLHGYRFNNLHQFLGSKLGAKETDRLVARYRVGTSRHWPGACVFWQTDIKGRVRTGKVMLYDAVSGKRVKSPFNHVTWAHSLMKIPDFKLRQCFFGEHLLNEDSCKPVALVESEKTALIADSYLPQFIWIATGGKNGCFNSEALKVLRGRQATLFPDLGATDEWRSKIPIMESLGIEVSLFDNLEKLANEDERNAGLDIADYLLRMETDEAVLQSMISRWPHLQKLIDTLDLELVSVSRSEDETTVGGGCRQ